MDKILLIDKPCGMTTTYVTNKIKKYFNAEKAGHTGTLDPLASGILLVCLGGFTRLNEWLSACEKEYEATFFLGATSDTGDAHASVRR